MANYVLYKRANGTEMKLKINSERAYELEERFGTSLTEKLAEANKFSVSAEYIAAAIPEGSYEDRKKAAFELYDEMTENGKTLQDYHDLINDILVKAGFLSASIVEAQRKLIALQQQTSLAVIEARMVEIQPKKESDTTALPN